MEPNIVLEVKDLKVEFKSKTRGLVKAVDGVTFSLRQGEVLGLVGESGSGKSMTSLGILKLLPANGRLSGGTVILDGENLTLKNEREMRSIRGAKISMILQDPMSCLNPAFTVGSQVGEVIDLHQHLKGDKLAKEIIESLRLVKIPAPEKRVKNYPHQLSGGMRQRVAGAIGLSCRPKVLIADEPTTSLDVTVQAQFLRLLKEIQEREQLAIILITHDLGIVARLCNRVAVMYGGRIVELGTTEQIFDKPSHPYTISLLKTMPKIEGGVDRLATIEGEPPDPANFPPGCRFAPRCPWATATCATYPDRITIEEGHWADCWYAGKLKGTADVASNRKPAAG